MSRSAARHVVVPVLELRIGKAVAFGPHGEPSAIGKEPVGGRVWLHREGLAGDEQGDRRHHGGPDKALHHYPREHYAWWRRELPEQTPLFDAGGFGENLSTDGLDEEGVCVGDVFRLGGATLQVSQARQPCWKLNLRFGLADMARRVQESGRTGWYYRVLEEGEVGVTDTLELIARPHPEWPLARVLHLLYHDCLNRPALAELAGLEPLAEGWRRLAAERLASGRVEAWSRRLETPR